MDLSVDYLGLRLAHPFMPGASPLVDRLSEVRKLEDAGASAIVMHSLFEEQILRDAYKRDETFKPALEFFPQRHRFVLDPAEYLEQIRRIKETVDLPVIASLNGSAPAAWLEYAKLTQQAGADALELNIYHIPSDPLETSAIVEERLLFAVREISRLVAIPVSLKLNPFYTALPNLATRLRQAGAQGLVLFNRFNQPDIDIEDHDLKPVTRFSDSNELTLRLHHLAILCDRCGHLSLACSGGVHNATDAIKAIMAGADVVQMVACLLRFGPEYLELLLQGVREWMEEHGYHNMAQLRGCMSLKHCSDPSGFERANYARILQSWRI